MTADLHPLSDASLVLAGNAVFTVVGRERRYTYRIAKPQDRRDEAEAPFFASLLTGPDNEGDFTYIGMILPSDPARVRPTRKSPASLVDGPAHKGLEWLLRRVLAGASTAPAALFHEGRCCRCGRRLTTPESVEAGIGPECIKHVGGGA